MSFMRCLLILLKLSKCSQQHDKRTWKGKGFLKDNNILEVHVSN